MTTQDDGSDTSDTGGDGARDTGVGPTDGITPDGTERDQSDHTHLIRLVEHLNYHDPECRCAWLLAAVEATDLPPRNAREWEERGLAYLAKGEAVPSGDSSSLASGSPSASPSTTLPMFEAMATDLGEAKSLTEVARALRLASRYVGGMGSRWTGDATSMAEQGAKDLMKMADAALQESSAIMDELESKGAALGLPVGDLTMMVALPGRGRSVMEGGGEPSPTQDAQPEKIVLTRPPLDLRDVDGMQYGLEELNAQTAQGGAAGFKGAVRSRETETTALEIRAAAELERVMEAQGFSRGELAERAGSVPPRVTKVLDGETNLTLRTLARFGVALGARWTLTLEVPGATQNAAVARHEQCIPVARYERVKEQRQSFQMQNVNEVRARLSAEAHVARLMTALEPFANFACDEPHVGEPLCHNCLARDARGAVERREVEWGAGPPRPAVHAEDCDSRYHNEDPEMCDCPAYNAEPNDA